MFRRIVPLALGTALVLGSSLAHADDAPAGDDAASTDTASADASSDSSADASATSSDASTSDEPRGAVGVDVGLLVPVGNLHHDTGVLLGGLVKVGYGLTPSVGVTGRIGYLYGFKTSTTIGGVAQKLGLSDLPIWLGGRYFVSGKCQGFHIGGELGLNVLMARQDFAGGSDSATRVKVGFNVLPGYRFGDVDVQAQLALLDIGHPGDSIALGATLGYDFAKF